jgi:hypothetical protein
MCDERVSKHNNAIVSILFPWRICIDADARFFGYNLNIKNIHDVVL